MIRTIKQKRGQEGIRKSESKYTVGHFIFWISLSLRLSLSSKDQPKREVIFRLDSANR